MNRRNLVPGKRDNFCLSSLGVLVNEKKKLFLFLRCWCFSSQVFFFSFLCHLKVKFRTIYIFNLATILKFAFFLFLLCRKGREGKGKSIGVTICWLPLLRSSKRPAILSLSELNLFKTIYFPLTRQLFPNSQSLSPTLMVSLLCRLSANKTHDSLGPSNFKVALEFGTQKMVPDHAHSIHLKSITGTFP